MRMLFRRGQAGARLDDELRFHLERQIAENVAAGMSAEDARSAALRSFGNPALVRDQARATWSWAQLESIARDVRLGMRTLGRSPGFAAIAILVMALGIGANVALFTVVRNVLLKPLPFADPDRLLMLYESGLIGGDQLNYNQVAGGVYSEWKKQNRSFSSMALVRESRVGLSASGGQLPEKLASGEFSWDLLPTLGVQPALGRNFSAADDSPSANGTVLLSWGLWKRRFGGSPAILNQTIYIDALPFTVIGVMPSGFDFPDSATQLWMPAHFENSEKDMTALSNHLFRVVGRLKPGVSAAQATADLNAISGRLHNAHLDDPFVMKGANSKPLLEYLVGDIRTPLYALLSATFCLLLIACLNMANLLVARAAARGRELAIRTALGGGWLRLMRERLIESLLLSAAGGALGLVLAAAALAWLVRTRSDMSRIESIHIDGVVAAFTVAVVVLCAVSAGLISAFSTSGKRILSVLNESSRSVSGSQAKATLRRVLLAVEIGLTAMLLIGAGLLVKSYDRLRSNDMGCATRNVITMHLGLPDARYKKPPDRANFFDALLERVRALPGVTAAGFANAVPGQGYWGDGVFTIAEHPPLPLGKGQYALSRWADPKYFEAMGIPLRRGRTFNPALRLGQADEAIVSQSFADRFLPGEEPLGKHLRIGDRRFAIVGVVGDTRYAISEDPMPTYYLSLEAGELTVGTLVIRSNQDPAQFALPVEQIVSRMDSDLPVSDILTMDQLVGGHTIDQSFNAKLLLAFASLSLALAAVGLFGVMSYTVAQRTGEIGIRIALGAQRGHVMRKMLADGLRPALLGLVLGLAGGALAVRAIRSMLYRTEPLDPAVFASVAGVLLLVALMACLAPAWRASRLDPMQALRTE
jgi:putative ABC transport system permease protein